MSNLYFLAGKEKIMTRSLLPQRRGNETVEFEHEGIRYFGTFSRFDDGRLAEVFLNSAKLGSTADVNARDAAISISIALQFGAPADVLRHALTRNTDGSAMGAIGKLMDLAQ